jgi:hypothetical protein
VPRARGCVTQADHSGVSRDEGIAGDEGIAAHGREEADRRARTEWSEGV